MNVPLLSQPIPALVRRELLSALRGKGLFIGLALLIAAYCFITVVQWPTDDALLGLSFGSATALFWYLCVIMMFGATLILPGFAAGTMAAERDSETYEQLHLTLLRPSGILLGKLFGSLGVFLLFFTASMPAFATVIFLTGMDAGQLASAAAVILVTGITCACLGLACGAFFSGTVPSLVAGYILVALYMGLPSLFLDWLYWILRRFEPALLLSLTTWAGSLLNYVVPWRVLSSASSGVLLGTDLALFVGFSALLSATALLLALTRLERPAEAPATRRELPTFRRGNGRRRAAFVFDEYRNPVSQRELLRATGNRWRMRTTLLLAALFFPLNLIPSPHDRIAPWFDTVTAFGFQIFILLWIVPAYAAPTLIRERATGNIDALRGTLLSPSDIVAGKLLGALGLMAPVLVAQLACGLPDALAEPLPGTWAAVATGYATMLLTVVEVACLSLVAGTLVRHTAPALVLGYLFSAAAYGGVAIGAFIVGAGLFDIALTDIATLTFAFPSAPLAYAFSSTMYAEESRMHMNGGCPGALIYWLGNVAAHALFTYACFRLAVHLFERRNRRDA